MATPDATPGNLAVRTGEGAYKNVIIGIENGTISHEKLMDGLLADPGVRAHWERTAFARVVANQVIRCRVDHKLSQRALAHRLGLSRALVARLELGEHEPRFSTRRPLARDLGMRFSIELQQAGKAPATNLEGHQRQAERLTVDGVETFVLAG